MEWILEQVNRMGEVYVGLALPMLLQSAALTAVVLSVEFLLRTRARAALRYWLVVSVFAYLVLIPLLSLQPPSTHWHAGSAAYAAPTLPLPAGHTNAPLSQPITGQSQTTRTGVGEQPQSLTWEGAVFLLWLLGVIVAGGVFLRHAVAARRHVAGTRTANLLMNDVLDYCRKRMGVHGNVRLKVTEDTSQPVVWGLFWPVIVVPRNLGPTLGSRHLRDVLFHELAHIKRWDLWVNLVQNWVRVLYFYNPLLPILSAALRRLRDEAANEAVLDTIGDADHSYTQRLADVAILADRPPTPSLCTVGVA